MHIIYSESLYSLMSKYKNGYLHVISHKYYVLMVNKNSYNEYMDYINSLKDHLLKRFGDNIDLCVINDYIFIISDHDIKDEIYLQSEEYCNFNKKRNAKYTLFLSKQIVKISQFNFEYDKFDDIVQSVFNNNIHKNNFNFDYLLLLKKSLNYEENCCFYPILHPIVNILDNTVFFYEMLVRINDDVYKNTSIINMIMFYEEFDLITDFDTIMVNKLIKILIMHKEINISINISIKSIENIEWHDWLFSVLKLYSARVVLEITESTIRKSYEVIQLFIKKAHDINIKVAIDDFGNGNANITELYKLSADYIKLDGEIVLGLLEYGEYYDAFIIGLINLVRSQGKEVIAEFICDERIMLKAKDIGIKYMQGYHFKTSHKDLLEQYKL